MRSVVPPSRICRFSTALVIALAAFLSERAFAQEKIGPTDSVVVARGLTVFKEHCAICHFSESQAKKIGPGLAGIYKRAKFADGGKVDDISMEKWILNGGKNMPPFKPVLSAIQVRELIA